MTPDEELADEVLHHTLNLFRYSASQVAETLKRLKAMEARLVAELSTTLLSDAKKSEINAILKASKELISDYYEEIEESFDFELLGQSVSNVTANSLTVALGSDAIGLPAASYFASLASDALIEGAPSAQWWSAQSADTAFKFAQQLRQGLANGETNLQIIQRIVGSKTQAGIMPIAQRNAASLVQTSVQAVANDARRNTYLANADVIAGIQQISTLDSHTSLTCIAYSDQCWNLEFVPIRGSFLPYLGGCPRHFNCRSVEAPITKTFKELGVDIAEPGGTTRASDEGPVAASTTFDDFLNRKGTDYQDEMLGAGRADLWRDGKITLRDLVNGQGRPLTLEELQAKYGA